MAEALAPTRTHARAARAVARLLDWREAEAISGEWDDLARASLEPNPLFEPAFALSLAQHGPKEAQPRFIAVREVSGGQRLIGMFALNCNGLRSWESPLVSLGSPLLRQGWAQEALDALLAWGRAQDTKAPGFFHTRIDARGPTARAILSHAVRNGLPVQEFDRGSRAAMIRDDAGFMPQAAGKRRKELGRLMRRLQEKGEVSFASATTISQVRNAVEAFLALEGEGWKGDSGTALVCNPALATFTRTAIRRMAGMSRCRVEFMKLDGRPIAAGLLLLSNDQAFFWKIAHDEAYGAYSPGAQLTIEIARKLAEDSSINLADSCAMPDHPMIDALWPGRREIIDFYVGAGDAKSFERAVQIELARRNLRRLVKTAFLTLTGRQGSSG